jgi:hypothetical protein
LADAPNRRRSVANRPLDGVETAPSQALRAPIRRPLVARKPPTEVAGGRRRAEIDVAEEADAADLQAGPLAGAKSARQPGAPGA